MDADVVLVVDVAGACIAEPPDTIEEEATVEEATVVVALAPDPVLVEIGELVKPVVAAAAPPVEDGMVAPVAVVTPAVEEDTGIAVVVVLATVGTGPVALLVDAVVLALVDAGGAAATVVVIMEVVDEVTGIVWEVVNGGVGVTTGVTEAVEDLEALVIALDEGSVEAVVVAGERGAWAGELVDVGEPVAVGAGSAAEMVAVVAVAVELVGATVAAEAVLVGADELDVLKSDDGTELVPDVAAAPASVEVEEEDGALAAPAGALIMLWT